MNSTNTSPVLARLARAFDTPAARQRKQPQDRRGSGWRVPERYNLAMLEDLQKLARMRGTITTKHAFYSAIFIAHVYSDEHGRIANFLNWLAGAGADELAARRFLKNQGAAVFGSKVPFRVRHKTVVKDLSITADEMPLLPAFQPVDMKARMKKEAARKAEDRRAAGVIERSEYLSGAKARRVQILRLAADGLSNTAIAEAIGTTEGAARVLLHRARKKAAADLKNEQRNAALRLHAEGIEPAFLPGLIAEELGVPEKKAAAILKAALKAASKKGQ